MNTEIIEKTLLTLINEFKKDEEEKYNAVSNTIYSIHKSFLDEEELKTDILNKFLPQIKIVIKEIKEEIKQYPPQFCIFDVINLQRHENYNSNLLAKFLEINIENEATKLSFVKDFLIYLNDKFKWGYYGFESIEELEKINHSDIRIKREEYAESRRIDLFISYKKDFAIIIENKIYAGEQDNQLDDYYQNKKKDNYKNLYMIFLTPSGYEPYTLSEESKKELGNNFQTLKHSDIALWLEKILENEKYSFLHDSNILFKDNDNKYIKDYRLLKSAMIQTIHNANMISNNTKELDMTKEKIQKLLEEHLFNDIQTVEDAEEYKQMFNKINLILEDRKKTIISNKMINIFEFSKRIIDYFIIDDIKNYNQLGYEKVIKDMLYNWYSHIIDFSYIKESQIVLESSRDEYDTIYSYFGIYTDDVELIKQIKKLDKNINNIFEKFSKDSSGWIYKYNINIEEDNPEKIAEAMMKLYNLLKENL
ncbi:PD-(D/E)XK nuclease family protein [Brachyspira intermedia]|uniref:PDDEXK-like family protein n=1 Tax=Brachyspira intermedia TaxID=84377 RepID=UPI003006EEC4